MINLANISNRMDICHFLELQFRQIVSEHEISGKIDQLNMRNFQGILNVMKVFLSNIFEPDYKK